jgi:hypothetical protein
MKNRVADTKNLHAQITALMGIVMGESIAANKLVSGAFWGLSASSVLMNFKTLPRQVVRIMRVIGYGVIVTIVVGVVYGRTPLAQEMTAAQVTAGMLPGPVLGAAAMSAVASAGAEPPQPPQNLPVMSVDSARGIIWLYTYQGSKGWAYFRWDPAKGEAKQIHLSLDSRATVPDPFPTTIHDVRGGVMFLGWQRGSSDQVVALLTPKNKFHIAKLNVERSKPHILELRDGSVLIVGGIVGYEGKEKKFTNAVERVSFASDSFFSFSNGALSVERLPDIPGEIRRGISLVELSDGRVMALGGSWSPYIGHEPMTAETYLLDLVTKKWGAGPRMAEARNGATATLLPDGTVLVAGGWTPKNTWNDTPTRTTEHWNPRSNVFVSGSPLPVGIADHQAMWLPNRQGKQLLLVGGWVRAWYGNQSVLALDVENGAWRTVGEQCNASGKTGELTVTPFEYNGRPFVWCIPPDDKWKLVPLRLSTKGETNFQRFDPDKGIALHRSGMAFLPPHANDPGLAVGGTVDGGADSAAVDAVWLDGRIEGLAPPNHARRHAQVFRLQDGSILVAGGKGGDASRRTQHVPPFELLPSGVPLDQARWIDIDFDARNIAAMGLLGDGSLIALDNNGEVSRIKISADAPGKPHAEGSELPPLPQPRLIPSGTDISLVIRGLPDGRIIVAGGEVQNKRLAIMHEDSMDPNAADEYLRIGESEPTHDYDIYEPSANQWRQSAASRAYGGLLAVYDDGRVARLTANPKKSDESRSVNDDPLIEISSTDGRSWSELKAEELPIIGVQYNTRMFVLQDELFIAGEKLHTDIATLQWFNGATRRWETLWQSEPGQNWRNNVGRIIIRQLANGKRVMLPVAGLGGNVSGG